MSAAAAGAPPPPPPPPPPSKPTSIDDLPTELLMEIIRSLSHKDLLALVVLIYPLLGKDDRGIVPRLTRTLFYRITLRPPDRPPIDATSHFRNLPSELILMILDRLRPEDRISFVLSHRGLCYHYAPTLDERTVTRLRRWMLREETGYPGTDEGGEPDESGSSEQSGPSQESERPDRSHGSA
ncbi:hypothetical protein BDV96DRAFT_366819 [Lophiotrema nucula]|uniref:F-box domain-containing protein n=1 Tax=Lophiotrema nucula TaxID=690887 RepID=A0A6A5ZKX1_9PLEO|nr:hypothetical protein BDV96DRAFT_366819 [Lophiotrema nucula]